MFERGLCGIVIIIAHLPFKVLEAAMRLPGIQAPLPNKPAIKQVQRVHAARAERSRMCMCARKCAIVYVSYVRVGW